MSIIMNTERIGNFTSSEIWQLTKKARDGKSFGAPALDYIREKRYERKLGRALSTDSRARALTWGKSVEQIAFGKLPFEYELTSSVTITHPDIPYWCGSPDGYGNGAVIDIKCPITLKSFCQFIEAGNIDAIRADHPDGEKYYWQLVSNAILSELDCAELIVYVPYLTDLQGVKLSAMDEPGANWIHYADDTELPYLIEGGAYQDLNVFRFTVPESDMDLLTDCVKRAGEMLNA